MEEKLDLQTTYRAIVDAARERRYISYGELAKANGVKWSKARFPLNGQLGELMRIAAKRGSPLPGSIVVNRANIATGRLEGSSRNGFLAAAQELGLSVGDPEAFVKEQQEKMFEWAIDAPNALDLTENGSPHVPEISGPLVRPVFRTVAGCFEGPRRLRRTPKRHGQGR